MKLGLVRRGYSPTGGAEAYLRRFAAAAHAAGHETVLFASCEWNGWNGETILIPASGPRAFADALRKSQPRSQCDFTFSLERVWECDAYRAGDGVHAAWLDRRANYEPRWKSALHGINPKHRGLLRLERALFTGGAQRVIANSHIVKNEITARFGMAPERITVVRNGLPPWRDEPGLRARERAALGLSTDDYTLLFAGSGWKRKGLHFAIEATRRVPGAILLVAGRGTPSATPSCVRYLGPLGAEAMRGALAAADAFILPTIYDPFSNACLEALAAGLPVITTRSNGFAEIIEHGTEGTIATEARDVDALAAGVAAWADPARRDAVRPRLLEKGALFTIEENLRQTLAAIATPAI